MLYDEIEITFNDDIESGCFKSVLFKKVDFRKFDGMFTIHKTNIENPFPQSNEEKPIFVIEEKRIVFLNIISKANEK